MATILDDEGNEYVLFNGKAYYNQTHAAKYVYKTDTAFRRETKRLEKENGIAIPRMTLPTDRQNRYIDKRILDVFRRSIRVGKEQEWYDKLRRVVDEVN